ncbi:MAG: hypothetical protein CM15mP123_12360 [Gammaproteobacteria bacterium]|nr:MAG: hypothetical protein CM15mP123_12360 [Gammaproteobacteria bacterium]
MLSYQNEFCDLTLREGIDEYRDYLKKITVMFWVKIALKQKIKYSCHDATHVIFGLDTSLEEEAMLDCWIFFGGDYFKVTKEYFKGSLDIKETNEKVFDLVKEVGYLKYTYLYLRVIFQKWPKIFFRTRKMKKWDYFFSLNLLNSKISKIREDYNINILSPDERAMKKIIWSRAI